MLALRSLQNHLQNYLLNHNDEIAKHVVQPAHDSIKTRIDIYANAYRWRLIGILQIDFPGLFQLLGAEAFNQLGTEYLAAYPSHYCSVRYFGQDFCTFLQQHPKYHQDHCLIEMALFEWALINVCDSEDVPVLSVNDLAIYPQEQWGDLSFGLHSSLQLVTLSYNVPEVWQAYKEGRPLPSFESKPMRDWRLWRQGIQSYYCVTSDHEIKVLALLKQQKTFAEVCEALCEYLPEDEVPQQVAQFLLRWFNEGLISTVTLTTSDNI